MILSVKQVAQGYEQLTQTQTTVDRMDVSDFIFFEGSLDRSNPIVHERHYGGGGGGVRVTETNVAPVNEKGNEARRIIAYEEGEESVVSRPMR